MSISDYQVDVRCFAVFIALQLFASQAASEMGARSILGQDNWGVKDSTATNMALGASPRSKVAKMNNMHNNYQIILHFVKTNLKLFLRLVSTDIHNDEVSLTANEFNSLRILFKVKSPTPGQQSANLAQLTPFFSGSSQSQKVHMNALQDWLVGAVASAEEVDFAASQSRGLQV